MNPTFPNANAGAGMIDPLPPLPPPSAFMPPGGQNAGMQAPSIPTAQTVPLNSPLPEIPPPHMAAPYVFYRPPMQRPQPQYPPQMPPQMPPQPPVQQQQPPQPPPQPQQPPPQPQKPQGPTAPLPGNGLDDATINKLNERLNSESDSIRADAAIDFFKILEKNPGIADDPTYKPYVDAFMEKILNDPSPVVRQGGLLALELGHVKNPSQNTRTRLDVLAKKGSAYGVEGGAIQNIMQKLSTHFAGTGDHGATTDPHAAGNAQAGGAHGATGGPGALAGSNTATPHTTPDAGTGQNTDAAAMGQTDLPGMPPQDNASAPADAAAGGGDPLAGMGGMDPAAMMAALGANPAASQPGSRLNTISQSPAHNSPIPGFNAPVNATMAPGQRLNTVAQGGR